MGLNAINDTNDLTEGCEIQVFVVVKEIHWSIFVSFVCGKFLQGVFARSRGQGKGGSCSWI